MRVVILACALAVLGGGCAHRDAGPTVTGAAIYARVGALQADGRAMVEAGAGKRPVEVRREQYLVAADRSQLFEVAQVIEGCRGGDLEADPECTLVLLRDRRFRVHDTPPAAREPDEPKYLSGRAKVMLGGVAAAIPLAIAMKTCEFNGCEEVFGTLLGLDALLLVFLTFGFH